MFNSTKRILSVSPKSVGTFKEPARVNCSCAAELGAEIFSVKSVQDLFPLICNPEHHIDVITIDLDEVDYIFSGDTFNGISTVITLLDTMPARDSNGALVSRNTIIVGNASTETDPVVIRDFLSINGSVHGILPRGIGTNREERYLAMSEFLRGNAHIPESIQRSLRKKKTPTAAGSPMQLTPRQQQILDLIAKRGSSNKIIAKTLHISESTVKLHLSHIFKKFGVRNRTQLALFSHNAER